MIIFFPLLRQSKWWDPSNSRCHGPSQHPKKYALENSHGSFKVLLFPLVCMAGGCAPPILSDDRRTLSHRKALDSKFAINQYSFYFNFVSEGTPLEAMNSDSEFVNFGINSY
jgi:hypothetical protein